MERVRGKKKNLYVVVSFIMYVRYYKNAGFSTKDMLEIERLKILEGSQTTSKIVYAPIEYWAAARRLEEK